MYTLTYMSSTTYHLLPPTPRTQQQTQKKQAPRTPTPEERKVLQSLARRLVIKSDATAATGATGTEGEGAVGVGAGGFDLLAERRALLLDGVVDKKGACVAVG